MSATSHAEPDEPKAKIVMPPLNARAPRPPVVRLRRGVVVTATMGAAGLLAGALAWALVIQPELRARSSAPRPVEVEVKGRVRASEMITDRPATYSQLDQLPEPRQLGRRMAHPEPTRSPTPTSARPAPPRPGPDHAVLVQARGSGLFFDGPNRAGGGENAMAEPGTSPGRAEGYGAVYNTHGLLAPLSPYELKAGSVLPVILLTGIDTARGGPVIASLAENVRDTVSGRYLLVPQGARLLGRYEGESRHSDKRAFLVWDRLILPNGKSLVLDGEPGVDAQGAVGVEGKVDRRLGPLAVASLFAGAITTFGQMARDRDGETKGGWADAGNAAAIEAAQVGGKLVDRELNVRPSIRLRPGTRVRVMLTRDLILEPYQP